MLTLRFGENWQDLYDLELVLGSLHIASSSYSLDPAVSKAFAAQRTTWPIQLINDTRAWDHYDLTDSKDRTAVANQLRARWLDAYT